MIFYQLPPTTPVGDEQLQQMRIYILILGFKGLSNTRLFLSRDEKRSTLKRTSRRREKNHEYLTNGVDAGAQTQAIALNNCAIAKRSTVSPVRYVQRLPLKLFSLDSDL